MIMQGGVNLFKNYPKLLRLATAGTQLITEVSVSCQQSLRACSGGQSKSVELVKKSKMTFKYPDARRDESVKEEYHGVQVQDPYRWLEDPDSEETKKFVDAQNNVTMPYLTSCEAREAVNKKLTETFNFPKYTCPRREGDKFYYFMNTGLQNQNCMYVQDSLDAESRLFLDPNELSSDGTVALSTYSFSENGQIMAYSLSQSGSDWVTIHFKDVETGKDYPEVLERVKFSGISWTHDNKGIFYGQYPEAGDGSETVKNENNKLYYHRVGTAQSEDVMVLDFPEDPRLLCDAEVSDCGEWLVVTPRKLCKDNLLYFTHLLSLENGITSKLPMTKVVSEFEADYIYITNDGPDFIFRTNKDAPNYRLVKINFNNYSPENWTTLVAEDPKDVICWAEAVAGDKLILCYMRDVKNVLQIHDLKTGKMISELPLMMGCVSSYFARKKYQEIFYLFTSFLTPGIIYRCDLSVFPYEPKVFREITPPGLDLSQLEQKQVFYPSKDGTSVPMFIICKKGIEMDGKNTCLLYGYGGFNVSLQPSFSPSRMVLIKHFNTVMAIPNLRGGGEYGEKWHNGGRLFNKQNVFDDFHSAAEYLINTGYTSPRHLAIQGGSNGGLLVAACLNQRPDLYAAGIAQVGVLDMLRYHKFTIGAMWISDYGDPSDEEHFKNLIKYSPLHNIPDSLDGQYPATLLTTADHDDRVVPLHSLKFIATLQYKLGKQPHQVNPLLIRIETKAGHGTGKPTTKLIEEQTDSLCFLMKSVGFQFTP